jgi:hypothetical protein
MKVGTAANATITYQDSPVIAPPRGRRPEFIESENAAGLSYFFAFSLEQQLRSLPGSDQSQHCIASHGIA